MLKLPKIQRRTLRLFVAAAALFGAAHFAGAQTTNWVAYNDHRPGPLVPPFVPSPNSWGTSVRATTLNMGAPADTSGSLINFLTGDPLPVTVTFTRSGAPDDFGGVGRPIPTNTPAAGLFFGICDLAVDGIVGVNTSDDTATTNSVLTTFSGLNPAKRYVFRGTAMRNGSYAARWTLATIYADGFVDAHLNGTGPGVLTSNQLPTLLVAGQAAFNSGHNAQGAVVGWDFIAPAPDGTFSIKQEQYIGAIPGGAATNVASYGYAFGALLLAEVEAVAPTITTNPQAVTTVEQNRPITLRVAATGTPLLYQWYKEGVGAVPGATFPTLSIAQAALSDAGTYYAVVYNPLARATSTVAQVNVFADNTGPTVESIFSYPTVDALGVATLNQIIIEFTEPVQPASVSSTASYTVPGGGNPASVIVTNARSVVLVLASPLTQDTDYSVTLSGATDVLGNVAGSSSAPFHSWVSGGGNGLLFEAFNVAGTSVEVFSLTDSPDYPDNPFARANLGVFDSRAIFPDESHNQYGGRFRGVFIPPVSGNWSFFFRTRQRGVVYLNPNGLEAAGAVEILRESTGNTPLNWDRFTSPPQPLRAGRAYYIEALYKEGDSAGDFLKVAARLQSTGFPTPVDTADTEVDPSSIAGAFVAYPLAPRNLGGPLTFVQDLQNLTVEDSHPAILAPQVSNPSGLPLFYQWFRDGVPIPGANGPSYSLQATNTDHGATFRVQVAKIGSVTNSQTATLSVVPDTNGPVLLSIKGDDTFQKLTLSWSETVDQGAAIETGNYSIHDPMGNQVFVNSLVFNGTSVVLTVATMLPDSVYLVEVDFQQDLVGNVTRPVGTPLNDVNGIATNIHTFVFTPGLTRFQAYLDLPTAGTIADFVASPLYPDGSRFSFYTNVLYWQQSVPNLDQYAMRFTGRFVASETGTHRFDPANDDEVRLRIYPGQDASGVPSELTGTAASGLTGGPTLDVDLVAGNNYYFELIVRELAGSDLAGLAVTLPSGTVISPISPQYLASAADPRGALVTITQQPASATIPPGTNGSFSVRATGTVSSGPAPLAYQWQRNVGGTFVNIAGANSSNYVTGILTVGDSGSQYRALLFIPGATATSAVATVTVGSTPTGPTLRSTYSNGVVVLSWDAPARLQCTASLTPPINWKDVNTGGATTYTASPSNEFNVNLDAAQEPAPRGTGSGSGTVTLSNNVVIVDVTYSGLSGNRNNSHFHAPGARGVSAGVAYNTASIDTGAGATSGAIKGTVTLLNPGYGGKTIAQQIQDIRDGLWYLNIHSTTFGGGEIRGQVDPGVRFYRLISP